MWIKQGGHCAICGKHEYELKSGLVIDHDHHTKKVRGLLCYNCNMLLGHAWDSTIILKRAIKYLDMTNTGEIDLIEVEILSQSYI